MFTHKSVSVASGTLLLTLLSACMSAGPDYQSPFLVAADNWSEAHGGSAALLDGELREQNTSVNMLEGFSLFGDETLQSLQTRALENNTDLRSALLRFAQSRVQRDSAAAGNQPVLSASAAATRQRQSESGSATRLITAISPASQTASLIDFISDPFELYQAGFDASWEPDLWGRVGRSLEAADARVMGADAALAQVQLGLLSEVARSYFQLRGIQNQQSLLIQDIARAQDTLGLLRARVEAGLGTETEVLAQQSVLSDLQGRVPALQEQEAQALNALSYLLGDMPGSLQYVLTPESDWRLNSMPDLALGLPSQAVATRPDIRAAEARLREVTAQLGVAEADLYPRIVLGAGLGLESLETGEFSDWGSHQWSIGPRLSLPLFDQGRRRATIELRELQQQEAAIEFQRTVLAAWHEVDSALSRYTAERQRRVQLQDKQRSSDQSLALLQARYDSGLIDYLPVLEAQQRLNAARRELSESDTRLALDLVGLFKSLGRAAPIQGDDAVR